MQIEYRLWHEQGKQMIYPTKQPKGDIEDHLDESWYLLSQTGEVQDYFNGEEPKLSLPTRAYEGFNLVESMDIKPLFYINHDDKNGNKIYDGDVLEDSEGFWWEVKFDKLNKDDLPGWLLKRIGTDIKTRICPPVVKIIGNIYEKPDGYAVLDLVDVTNKGEDNEPNNSGNSEASSEGIEATTTTDAATSSAGADSQSDCRGGNGEGLHEDSRNGSPDDGTTNPAPSAESKKS